MVVDCFTYNGEEDVLDIHLNVVGGLVDQFVICEAKTTFSGKEKELYFPKVASKYSHLPIKYFVIDENDEDLWEMARNSPNTRGAEHWKREFVQKESIKKALTHLQDDDIVFIGDVDEILEPIFYVKPQETLTKYKLRVYTYFINNRSSESFWGPISVKYGDIKNACLNHARNNNEKRNTLSYCGWHFTSLKDGLKRKLEDSYTSDSYASSSVLDNLESNISAKKDFLGRPFSFSIDESEWPKYLKENKDKYKHLCEN